MLTVSFNELTKEDLDRFSFVFGGNTCIRFCIDITHQVIILCEQDEDHVTGAELWLGNEQDISAFDLEQIAESVKNHIIGASIFTDLKKQKEAFLLVGGSSVEQGLKLYNKFHKKESIDIGAKLAQDLFSRFYEKLRVKKA